jgi:DNA-binding PadR family transcriptional regulator
MFSDAFYSTGGRSGCRPRHGGGRGVAYGPRGEFGGFGFGFGGHRGGPGGRGRRARRGDIRTAALLLLAEEPRNGYQIMQEVQERSGGMWSPSPGSVYPALAQLEDEGLIRTEEHDGRKQFVLTDAGRQLVDERDSERAAPWEQQDYDRDEVHELGRLMREVASAFVQVMKAGSRAQMARAREVLDATRRDLYRILADGDLGPKGERGEGDSAEGERGEGDSAEGERGEPEAGGDVGTVDVDS